MMGNYYHPFGSMGWGGFTFMIVFWLVVIVLLLFIIKDVHFRHKSLREDPSIQILKERYAKGEIEEDEFLSKLNVLKK